MGDIKEKVKDMYVDKNKFREEYNIWKEKLLHARENNLPEPRITEYLGECIYKICTRLTFLPKFLNYTYKDKFIDLGLENCIKYFDKYDDDAIVYKLPEGSSRKKISFSKKKWDKLTKDEQDYYSSLPNERTAGPFAYFTNVAYWAFVEVINDEKYEQMVKSKYISNLSNVISEIREYDVEEFSNEYVTYLQNLIDVDFNEYENRISNRNKKVIDSDEIVDNYEIDDDIPEREEIDE